MTHSGYSFKRPTLKSNYIRVLSTIDLLNDNGFHPTRKQLLSAMTPRLGDWWNEQRGYRRILQNLISKECIEEDKENGQITITVNGAYLLYSAAEKTGMAITRN